MPTITGGFPHLEFNAAAYKAAVESVLQVQIRMAARAWLRAVIPIVPVWSGEARGSLKPLGQFLRVSVPISVSATAPYNRTAQGMQEQRFEFTDGPIYSFEWSSSVIHFYLNEYYESSLPLIHPTPWHSMEAGTAAFRAYLDQNLAKKLPSIEKYLTMRPTR